MNRASLVGHLLELLSEVDVVSQAPDRITAEFFHARKYLGSHDRRFVAESLYGMIRHRRLIESILEQYCASSPHHAAIGARGVKALPLYAVFAMAVEQEAAASISESINSRWCMTFPSVPLGAFLQWVSGVPPAQQYPPASSTALGILYSFQDWIVDEWRGQVGDEVEKMLQSFNVSARVTLRVNLARASRIECQGRLLEEGIETLPTEFSPSGLVATRRFSLQSSRAFRDGWIELQDEASQIVSLIADPKPGQSVIDACAGAGGKSLHLADLMQGKGSLLAIDIEEKRLAELRNRATRAGIRCLTLMQGSVTQTHKALPQADVVLVDAPCSGVGTIRRNPWFKWSVTPELVERQASVQSSILDSSAQLVRRGGNLVYCTCSLVRQENEDVVRKFLDSHAEFEMFDPAGIAQQYRLQPEGMYIKLYPHRHSTDGFFIARMIRS